MATAATANPCAGCTIHQDCCAHLSGLRLTAIEYERCFARHADSLTIEREGPVFVVSPRDGGPCPNWRDGSCTVYDARPRECRLFPHTLYVRQHRPALVTLRHHSDTRCPLKNELLTDADTASAEVLSFAREAFGTEIAIEVAPETAGERLVRRLRAAPYELLRALRIR